jgi:hypothetical protein
MDLSDSCDREESRDILKKLLKISVSGNVGSFLTKDFVSTVLDIAPCGYLVSYLGLFLFTSSMHK